MLLRISLAVLFVSWAVAHPFDPLTSTEISAGVATAQTSGFPTPQWKLYGCDLGIPNKTQVLAWEAGTGPTPARVATLWLRQPGTTSLSVVDVDVTDTTAPKMLQTNQVHNVQPPMRGDSGEFDAGLKAALAHPEVIAALSDRGLSADQVTADYDSVGNYPGVSGIAPRKAAFEFYMAEGDNMYSRPLAVKALVDLDNATVLSVYNGHISSDDIPPEQGGDLDVPTRQDPPREFKTSRPSGVSFTRQDNVLSWQKWQFHLRTDWRVGSAVGMVRYNDSGRMRSIAHEIYLSEMLVPYQLANQQWYYRTFLDAGEFGLGSDANTLTQAECGGSDAEFFDLYDVKIDGTVVKMNSIACVFERFTGDPVWLHGKVCPAGHKCAPKQVRAAVELVVRTVPKVGNYDYVCDTIFRLDGSIHFKVGATGIDAMKAVRAQAPVPGQMSHAAQMDGYRAAPYHDHIFNFRIDLDVDGVDNQLVIGKIEQYVPQGVPRPAMWGVNFQKIDDEQHGKRNLDDAIRRPEVWLVQNPNHVNPVTNNCAGWTIVPSANLATLMRSDDPLLARSGFTKQHLWTTPYSQHERFAAGDWPNQHKGGIDGIDVWSSRNRSIDNTDLVLWYTVGFHHVTLQENLPVLPTFWGAEFDLMPANFFNRNPGLDLPQAKQGVE